ncbi:glucosaminidase domain-containing protein [Flavobacterium columnare]|nr:muramidase [Flavobacterium columnare]GEM58229.1 muramidase [Flavobacterium columnare NBRC 100251 = ATCC 23463]ANO49034.1 muramidase [Flavobacterium columnare]MBF6653473.1 muramidase [Flavobacterium columnare]MBF6656086.1 muramidase [Flavobacterium columnare]
MLMKNLKFYFLFVFTFLSVCSGYSQSESYIKEYGEIADKLSFEFGIPRSIILSIAIVESGYGNSKVAKKLNNHFGIKGKNQVTWSSFKQYSSVEDSFRDFCLKMASKKFYMNLKGSDDYLLWLKKISLTGYSTKPTLWRNKIKKTILKHKLH